MPAKGELNIKDRRSWKTWQLALAIVVAALVGMGLNYHTVGSNKPSGSAYALPPASGGSGSTTTATTSAPSGGEGGTSSTTTTTSASGGASGSTTTTTAASPTPTTGPAQVLLGAHQSSGNWTSTAFTTTAPGWDIGWAFQCTPAPASGPSFEVFVTTVGGTPTGTPAVDGTGASGQSVTTQSSLGQQTLVVEAPANCVWVVKVTGS